MPYCDVVLVHASASELARAGYVVVVIDMFYWGERRLLFDADPAADTPDPGRARQFRHRPSVRAYSPVTTSTQRTDEPGADSLLLIGLVD